MLRYRVLSAIVMLPLTIGVLMLGGWWYLAAIGLVLTLAAWEFVGLMRKGDHSPWLAGTLALVWISLIDLERPSWELFTPGLTVVLLASLSLTLAGGLYLGWVGANFLRLRGLDNGLYWSVIAFGSTWLADSGAYFIGRAWGRHKLASKLSPGKTWEGIIGGLVVGALSTTLLAALFGLGVWHGFTLGVLIATLSPIGDLGVSMIKRQVGAKDSSKLIPGHGGFFDRIDSLLISVTIGTYYVLWIVQRGDF